MFVQDNLRKLKEVFDTNFPKTRFFTMFVGAAFALSYLLVPGSRAADAAEKADFVWILVATGLQVAIGAGTGFRMFTKGRTFLSAPPSIRPNFA